MEHAQFFKEAAKHQTEFRKKISENYKEFPNYPDVQYWLTDEDGKNGKIYYDGFDVIKSVRERYFNFHDQRDSNMLRSEHIPFNLFIPFRKDLDFCKKVFNEILGNCIKRIDSQSIVDNKKNIKIEYAPSPKEKYLNDRTSFDAYIEYTHTDNSKGIIGIEVKYTEKEYPLVKFQKNKETNEKELTKAWIDVENFKKQNNNSIYYNVTKACKLYKPEHFLHLVENKYRQIWSNHLLAESILIEDEDKFKHAHSLIFYPKANEHFTEAGKEYSEMLIDNKDNKFVLVTYEDFIAKCRKHCVNSEFKNEFEQWINYLQNRYLWK